MGIKIYVVDNGGQWTHREWRVLKYLGIETEIIPNNTPFEKIDVKGLVLSGGAPSIRTERMKLGNTSEYLEKAEFPVLGICVAHQFMAIHFGGESGLAEIPEYGKTEIIVDESDELFKGLPERFIAWESHNDEIKKLPEGFIRLAHSENCQFQAIRHKERLIFGVQFHPEVEHTEYGYDIFKNFIELCK